MLTTNELEQDYVDMGKGIVPPPPYNLPSSIVIVEGQKLRSGVPVVAGYMPAGALIPDNFDIPSYGARSGQGYQRPIQDTRVNELVQGLKKKRVDLPTAILLNSRNREAKQALRDHTLRLSFLRDSAATANSFTLLTASTA